SRGARRSGSRRSRERAAGGPTTRLTLMIFASRALCAGLVLGSLLFHGPLTAAPAPSIDSAFARFWESKNPQEAGKAVQDIVGSGITFDGALARFKRGRPYAASVKRGT